MIITVEMKIVICRRTNAVRRKGNETFGVAKLNIMKTKARFFRHLFFLRYPNGLAVRRVTMFWGSSIFAEIDEIDGKLTFARVLIMTLGCEAREARREKRGPVNRVSYGCSRSSIGFRKVSHSSTESGEMRRKIFFKEIPTEERTLFPAS